MAEPALFDLREALARLGCGRTFLLAHLAAHPMHAASPTHRRIGRAIMFTEADFARLLETFAPCQSKSSAEKAPPPSSSAAPSADRAFSRALERLTPRKPKPSARSGKPSCGIVVSMAPRP